jgi:hypothetical protein
VAPHIRAIFSPVRNHATTEVQELDIAAKEFEIVLNRSKTALQIENIHLEKELRAKWKTKVLFSEEAIVERALRRINPEQLATSRLAKAETAIDEFIIAARALDEPAANEVLLSANKIVESSTSVETKVSALKTIAETKLPGTTAVATLRSVESSIRRSPGILRPHELPPRIRPPIVIKPPQPHVPWWRRIPRR